MSEAIISLSPHLAKAAAEAEAAQAAEAEAAAATAANTAPFVLRVLNGKQQGAEIGLEAGRYRLGTHEDNDIVLLDEAIEGEHLELFFDADEGEGQATLTQLHKEIYINNRRVTQNDLPLNLPLQDIIMIGGVAVSINAADDEWQQLDSINEEVVSTLALIKASEPPNLWLAVRNQFQDKQRAALSILSLSLIASIFIVLLAFSLHSTQQPQSIATAAADKLLAQLATHPAYEHIRLIDSRPKKQLIGYVKRTEDLNRLRNLAAASLVDINIVSIEKIDKSLNVIAQVYGGNLSYKLVPKKDRDVHLLLYGTIEASQQREALRAVLRRDLQAITSIKIDVITQTEAMEILNTWLNNYPLFAGLKAEKKKEGIFIRGNLLGNAKEKWQKALSETPPALPQNMLPFIDIYFSPPFTGKIVSFIVGKNPQLRIFYKDGTRLASIGDKVRGGFVIKSIQRNKIILSWYKREFIYPLPN